MLEKQKNPFDPRGLIYEAYRIEGISEAECKSIFLDWAMEVAGQFDSETAIKAVLAMHQIDAPDHPMTRILTEGLAKSVPQGRRGGRKRLAN